MVLLPIRSSSERSSPQSKVTVRGWVLGFSTCAARDPCILHPSVWVPLSALLPSKLLSDGHPTAGDAPHGFLASARPCPICHRHVGREPVEARFLCPFLHFKYFQVAMLSPFSQGQALAVHKVSSPRFVLLCTSRCCHLQAALCCVGGLPHSYRLLGSPGTLLLACSTEEPTGRSLDTGTCYDLPPLSP